MLNLAKWARIEQISEFESQKLAWVGIIDTKGQDALFGRGFCLSEKKLRLVKFIF